MGLYVGQWRSLASPLKVGMYERRRRVGEMKAPSYVEGGMNVGMYWAVWQLLTCGIDFPSRCSFSLGLPLRQAGLSAVLVSCDVCWRSKSPPPTLLLLRRAIHCS